ncbi:hypothetical protein EHF33_11140 [Deinococcus psychrotolerans]|uniref:Uncharacterized protein n=1 Tax=Deinococcus psychrotolerans TaxID=2489213 RepID=A0A3G8YD15_9DEIO|nr:hypothetical protein [Deinococcus psychrotolerans]AZI43228.1 hypothetical protein EHF33_11140 [Deinococcus psychrotolerans]
MFRRKKTNQPVLFSNLDWPVVPVESWDTAQTSEADALNLVRLSGRHLEAWEAVGIKIAQFLAPQLTQDETGQDMLLEVPLLAYQHQQAFWIFIYSAATPQAASHFISVEQMALKAGATAGYFAPAPLPLKGAEGRSLFDPFHFPLFVLEQDKPLPEDDYLMWWPESAEDRLVGSEYAQMLERIYQLQDEYGSLLCGVIALQVGWAEAESGVARADFPAQTAYAHVECPSGLPMVISMSQEKGLRFHFARSRNSLAQRLALLRVMERYLSQLTLAAREAELPSDAQRRGPEDEKPSRWWSGMPRFVDNRLDQGMDWLSMSVGLIMTSAQG